MRGSKAVLKFLLERGPTLEQLENIEATGEVVETLESRPDANLPPELSYILRLFGSLSSHRPAGMSITAIPYTEIEAHWRIYLASDDVMSLAEFTDWMTMLDDVVMDYHHKKDEEDRRKSKSQEITPHG
jgi:hypothetical protein